MLGLGEEVELVAVVELLLADLASFEERLACGIEGAVQHGEENDSFLAQHLSSLVVEPTEDVDILEDLVGVDGRRHDVSACQSFLPNWYSDLTGIAEIVGEEVMRCGAEEEAHNGSVVLIRHDTEQSYV